MSSASGMKKYRGKLVDERNGDQGRKMAGKSRPSQAVSDLFF